MHRFRNRYNLKNIEIIEEAALTDEEAAALFMTKFTKIVNDEEYELKQV